MHSKHIALLLAALLPFAAQAGTRSEVGRDLDDARQEVHADMARERAKLDSDNLSLDGLHFGKDGDRKARTAKADLPRAEITSAGDFLIDGTAQPIDARQRQQQGGGEDSLGHGRVLVTCGAADQLSSRQRRRRMAPKIIAMPARAPIHSCGVSSVE